ncbi:MAG: transcriptional repressor [Proteobacteria bacterium]|nr:MAG: transcriptional repressor [Pseudomonadota bacterium]
MHVEPCQHSSHRTPAAERLQEGLLRLKAAGLRITKPREKILSVLASAPKPLSSEEVHARLKDSDLVTVYRTLLSMEEAEILRRADFGDGVRRYEFANAHHHHHYVICRGCQKIEPFDECPFSATKKALEKRGYKKVQHTLEVFALCESCQEKEET